MPTRNNVAFIVPKYTYAQLHDRVEKKAVPVEVCGASDSHETVSISEFCEHSNFVVTFELYANRHDRGSVG